MGTRSLTFVHDREGLPAICCMYRQSDGYPSGHGSELAGFLNDIVVVNGIPGVRPSAKLANGAGCLAAQMVGYFKEDVGQIYMVPTTETGEDYNYHISADELNQIQISVEHSDGEEIFRGSVDEFIVFCEEN